MAEEEKPKCNCELSKQFRVTEDGDIVPVTISDEELAELRRKRSMA